MVLSNSAVLFQGNIPSSVLVLPSWSRGISVYLWHDKMFEKTWNLFAFLSWWPYGMKHYFLHVWAFVKGIHRDQWIPLTKGQYFITLIVSLLLAWTSRGRKTVELQVIGGNVTLLKRQCNAFGFQNSGSVSCKGFSKDFCIVNSTLVSWH